MPKKHLEITYTPTVLPSIEDVIRHISDGKSYRVIADIYNIPHTSLFNYVNLHEHSARVREAKRQVAYECIAKAEEVLLNAGPDMISIAKAKELSQFYRWKAKVFAPKDFGEKVDVTSGGEKLLPPVIVVESEQAKKDLERL